MPFSRGLLFALFLTTLFALYPLLAFIDGQCIRLWDESRQVLNAIEMTQNHNFLIPHFDGNPDMWNTKPPLLIWLQVMTIKSFGLNEIAIRLPSVLAGIGTLVLLILIQYKNHHSYWPGIISVLVLVSSPGYVSEHSVRTGDYDALLTFFLILQLYFSISSLENLQKRYLYFLALSIGAAVLTKSIAGFFFIPGIFLFLSLNGNLSPLLRTKHFYISVCLVLLITIGYYGLREMYNPGYLQAVMDNELFGRYQHTIEDHKGPFFYYLTEMGARRNPLWIYVLPLALMAGLLYLPKESKKNNAFIILLTVTFLLVISSAGTKLTWYDVPAFPLMALLIGSGFYALSFKLKLTQWWNKLVFIAAFLLLFMYPYSLVLNQIRLPHKLDQETPLYGIPYFFKKIRQMKWRFIVIP